MCSINCCFLFSLTTRNRFLFLIGLIRSYSCTHTHFEFTRPFCFSRCGHRFSHCVSMLCFSVVALAVVPGFPRLKYGYQPLWNTFSNWGCSQPRSSGNIARWSSRMRSYKNSKEHRACCHHTRQQHPAAPLHWHQQQISKRKPATLLALEAWGGGERKFSYAKYKWHSPYWNKTKLKLAAADLRNFKRKTQKVRCLGKLSPGIFR
jgi:hypothetical protein